MATAAKKKHFPPPSDQQKGIWGLKRVLLDEGNNPNMVEADKALLKAARDELEGIPADIAGKALRFKKISEKQAYCVARALIEAGKVHYSSYMDK